MKYQKEIEKLEAELSELKRRASEAETTAYRFPVPKDSDLFSEFIVPCDGAVDVLYAHFRLSPPSKEKFTFDEAQNLLVNDDARLLTKEEILYLLAVGVLKQGDENFWSASVVSFDRAFAWYFNGYSGNVSLSSHTNELVVRTISRR